MGLAERRAAKQFETEKLPKLQAEINQVVEFEVPLEIDWLAIAADGYADDYTEFFYKVYFLPLIEALRDICMHDMGKQALRYGLRKVVVTNQDSPNPQFADGVLYLLYSSVNNIDYWIERKTDIQIVLVSGCSRVTNALITR